jgi:hypothetical protein
MMTTRHHHPRLTRRRLGRRVQRLVFGSIHGPRLSDTGLHCIAVMHIHIPRAVRALSIERRAQAHHGDAEVQSP